MVAHVPELHKQTQGPYFSTRILHRFGKACTLLILVVSLLTIWEMLKANFIFVVVL